VPIITVLEKEQDTHEILPLRSKTKKVKRKERKSTKNVYVKIKTTMITKKNL